MLLRTRTLRRSSPIPSVAAGVFSRSIGGCVQRLLLCHLPTSVGYTNEQARKLGGAAKNAGDRDISLRGTDVETRTRISRSLWEVHPCPAPPRWSARSRRP